MFQPKIHPDLAIATLRQHKDRLYRLWTLARALDEPRGSGIIPLADLQAAIAEQGYRGLSPGTLRRLVNDGEGLFWQAYHKDGGRYLQLHGLTKVCASLGVRKLRLSPLYLKPRHLKTMLAFRSACHAAQFVGEDFGRPISRKTLAQRGGRGSDSQRRYERAMNVEKIRNAQVVKEWRRDIEVPDGCFVGIVEGHPYILKRLPNSYRATLEQAPRGMIRQVNRSLAGNPSRICGEGTQPPGRLFYDDSTGAQRRAQALDEGDEFFLKGDTTTVGGIVLWSSWMILGSRLFCA